MSVNYKLPLICIFSLTSLILWNNTFATYYSEYDLSSNQTYIKSKTTDWINVWITAFQENANKLDNSEEYINKAKKDLYDYISKYRSENNLTPLTINPKLDSVSQSFAKYMSNTWILTHFDDNWNDWWYRISQQWMPLSYRWEIVSSSVDLSWAIESRKESKWHREIFISNKYNSYGIWYYKWMRAVLYYYEKPPTVKNTNTNTTTLKSSKVCIKKITKKTWSKIKKKNIYTTTCIKYK